MRSRPRSYGAVAQLLPWTAGGFVLVLGAALTLGAARLQSRYLDAREVLLSTSVLEERVQGFQTALVLRLQLAEDLAAVVRADPDFAARNFSSIADAMVLSVPGVLSLQLAPDGVVGLVTNPERNAAVLGRNLLESANDSTEARAAIRTRSMRLQGPFDLVQGGRGVVARLPIFRTGPGQPGPGRFWGFASVVLDADTLVSDVSARQSTSDEFDLAIRAGNGATLGSARVFEHPEVLSRSVPVPGGAWEVAVAPRGAPAAAAVNAVRLIAFFGFIATFLSAGVVVHLIRVPASLRLAVDRAVADLERANEEVAEHLAAAERASAAKSQLMRNMSHEFRTPLNAIIGFSDILAQGTFGPLEAKQRRLVANVLESARHLLAMVNRLLDLAAVDRGQMAMAVQPLAPGPELRACVELSEVSAREAEVTLHDGVSHGQPPRVLATQTAFRQVLLNLLSNAIKYNRRGGAVFIEHGPGAPGRWRFSVRDTGPGLSDQEKSQIFEPFERLGAGSSGVEGSGLGLTITRDLLGQVGGEIGIDSAQGVGTTFWFELPIADA